MKQKLNCHMTLITFYILTVCILYFVFLYVFVLSNIKWRTFPSSIEKSSENFKKQRGLCHNCTPS